jgi:hypothetical protein
MMLPTSFLVQALFSINLVCVQAGGDLPGGGRGGQGLQGGAAAQLPALQGLSVSRVQVQAASRPTPGDLCTL